MPKLIETGREIVRINGVQYYTDNPDIAKDYFSGEWVRKRDCIKLLKSFNIHPIHGLDNLLEWVYTMDCYKVESREYTYFLRTSNGNFHTIKDYKKTGTGSLHPSIEESDSDYIFFDDYMNKRLNNPKKFREFNNIVSKFKDLDNSQIPDEDRKLLLDRDIEFGVRTLTNKIFEGLNYTFGIELETNTGRVTEIECDGLNLRCEFDGSLRDTPDQKKEEVLGGEYVTGVLIGDAGMYQLNKICGILAKKCTVNAKCGVHAHIGNLKFTKENIVYMYILAKALEPEIFSIMPKSRRNNTYCRSLKDLGLKSKNLNCNTPLLYKIIIDEYFHLIFKEVSGGRVPDKKYNKQSNHPSGSKCGYDKNTQRYCWLNFVTAMFNTKRSTDAYTLEFRIHYATLNYTKVKNWLKLCVAFVNFAENYQSAIRKGYWENKCGERFSICLSTIIKASYPRSGKILDEYIEERKNRFLLDNGDIEALEYSKDTEGITNLNKKECVL